MLFDGRDYPVQKLKQLEMGVQEVRWKGKVILEQGGGLEYNELWRCLFEHHCATTKRNQIINIICLFDAKLWHCVGDAECSNKHCPCYRQDKGEDARNNPKNNNNLTSR